MKRAPRVFISYAHQSERVAKLVLGLARRLRENGVDARIDQFELSPAEGWPAWIQEQVASSDYILVICTSRYRERFDRSRSSSDEKLSVLEPMIVKNALAHDHVQKVIPVLLEESSDEDVPLALRVFTSYSYPAMFDALYRRLTDQPETPPPPIGPLRILAPGNRELRLDSEVLDVLSSYPVSTGGDVGLVANPDAERHALEIRRSTAVEEYLRSLPKDVQRAVLKREAMRAIQEAEVAADLLRLSIVRHERRLTVGRGLIFAGAIIVTLTIMSRSLARGSVDWFPLAIGILLSFVGYVFAFTGRSLVSVLRERSDSHRERLNHASEVLGLQRGGGEIGLLSSHDVKTGADSEVVADG